MRKSKFPRNCICCGREFDVHPYRAHEAKYCSRQCYFSHSARPLSDRINYRVSDSGCWEWAGYRSPEGYGRVGIRSKSQVAHRAYWEEVNGPVPKGMVLDHKCRNRACINPDHLRVVTVGQNNHMGKVMRKVFAWRDRPDPSA